MSLHELAAWISKDSGVPKAKVLLVLKEFMRVTDSTVKAGVSVHLTGFGTFYLKQQKERLLFGGERSIKRKQVIKFRESRK